MINCIDCKIDFPEELISPTFMNGKYYNLCAICARKRINKATGLPEDTPFRGEQAQKYYELTLEYLELRSRK